MQLGQKGGGLLRAICQELQSYGATPIFVFDSNRPKEAPTNTGVTIAREPVARRIEACPVRRRVAETRSCGIEDHKARGDPFVAST